MRPKKRKIYGESATLHQFLGPFGRFSYPKYKKIQQDANIRKLNTQWAQQENITYLAEFLKRSLAPDLQFGLCHGTRQGNEQKWFREALGCEVLGTEISETATQFANTIEWDFHNVKPEWVGAVDFIYSNSLDHSYNPVLAVESWVSCLRPGGMLLLEHSDRHQPEGATKVDPFGITLAELVLFITRLGAGSFWVQRILEDLPRSRKPPGYIACVVVKKATG
jgi:SAM-dependent methyltransferase